MGRTLFSLALLSAAGVLGGCGPTDSPQTPTSPAGPHAPLPASTPTLVSLTLSPTSAGLLTGTSQQFVAVGHMSDGSVTTPAVMWSATGGSVTSGGLYTAGGTVGSYTVTALSKLGQASASIAISAPPPMLVSILVLPAALSLQTGTAQQYSAIGTYSDGSTQQVTGTATWSSTGGLISTSGRFTAGAAGSGLITATLGSVSGSTSVTITIQPPPPPSPPTLVSLTLSPTKAELLTGKSQQFAAVGHMSDGSVNSTPAVTWSATGGSVTTGGLYTAGATAGSFAVTAKSGTVQVSAPIAVSVSPSPTLVSLTLSPTSAGLLTGASQQFAAAGHLSDGSVNSAPAVTWSATGGSITTGGLYMAGSTTGSYSVTARSGTVQVSAPIVISAPPPPSPNPSLGQIAFAQECATCHAARDGFDLAYFNYADTTIVRRALKHVNSTTAWQIAAYIRSLNTPHAPQNLRLFQPGGSTVASDVDFALGLFGQDAWPATMTVSQLRAIDPLQLRIVPSLLVWSDEGSNLDWMPDNPLPSAILTYAGSAGANALASYNASPTTQHLVAAVTALYKADHASANPGAPCMFFVASRVNYEQCFEVRRWISSLVAQHMLRFGITRPIATPLHSIWWEVGDAARRSRNQAGQVANTVQNWVAWMYLGWMFDPAGIAAKYGTGGLRSMGLSRHATFVALRSMVARPPGAFEEDLTPWIDFEEFALSVPASWATPAATFALHHLINRLNSGDRPPAGPATDIAIHQVNSGMTTLATKVPAANLASLTTLSNQVITLLRN
jgi:predicted aconitase with swiveling domain